MQKIDCSSIPYLCANEKSVILFRFQTATIDIKKPAGIFACKLSKRDDFVGKS
jgi:hypothetical protein